MTMFTTATNQVSSLYVGYYAHAGDPAGENSLISQLNSGASTLSQIAASFASQPEATARYPYLANPNTSDPATFVDQVYQNMFNHPADAAGKAYWVGQLNAAKGSPSAVGTMILNIISGATGTDSTTITNKVDVASDFTVKATNAGTAWNASAAARSSMEIASVTDTAASVTAAKAQTDTYIASAAGPQQSFTFGLDTLTSGAQNANFNAPLIANVAPTLQSGDSAIDTAPLTGPGLSNGGTFTTVLNSPALVTLQGIPTHTVTSIAADSGYLGNITGLVTLNNINSTASLTLGALGRGIDMGGLAGTANTGATLLSAVNANNVAAGATTVFVDTAALAGMSDTLGINVTGPFGTGTAIATANRISIKNDTAAAGATDNAYETLNLNATGPTNLALADAASGFLSTKTVNVAGTGATVLWGEGTEAHFKNVTVIDATATQIGGLTVTGASSAGGFLTGAVLSSFKGGTGADSVDLSGMTAAQVAAITAGNLDGGTGTARDTLILSSAAATSTNALHNSNFETIAITGLTGTVDVSKFGAGVDTVALAGFQASGAVFNNLPSGMTVALGDNSLGIPETFNAMGTALTDAVNVTAAGSINYYGLGVETFNGFETINQTITNAPNPNGMGIARITATPSAGGTVTFNLVDNGTNGFAAGAIDLGKGGTLNISGTDPGGALLVGPLTKLVTLDASGLNTGASATNPGLTMGSGVIYGPGVLGGATIVGSNGADKLIGTLFADTIDGGPGNDVIKGSWLTIGPSGGDRITGGSGVDQVILNNFAPPGWSMSDVYKYNTIYTDMTVGTGPVGTTDFITLPTTDFFTLNFAVHTARAAVLQGDWAVQSLTNANGTVAITSNNQVTGATLLKFTSGVAMDGLTGLEAFRAAIGATVVTGVTPNEGYYFTMYDTSSGKMDIGCVDVQYDRSVIDANDGLVQLVGAVNMSAADYAHIGANHFSLSDRL